MRTVEYQTEPLKDAFCREKVLTLDVVKKALGMPARMTAFRRLKCLDYRASCSHAGRYYTLNEIADYDEHGLWVFNGICFSRHGSLVNTLEHLVCASREGYFASELQGLLHIRVRNALAGLCQGGRLHREQIGREYLYVSAMMGDRQLDRRKRSIQEGTANKPEDAFGAEKIQEGLRTLLSVLNEKQRRLYLGFESMKLGYGGDTRISQVSGVNVKTIARGRRELDSKNVTPHRIRQAGAGRPSIKKN